MPFSDLKVTNPASVPPPGAMALTVTEKVIVCPRAEGLVEEVTLPIEVLA